MEELQELSAHKCVLLAAQYATESNIKALRALTAVRADDLEFGLILRLLLTFLPEAVEPSRYVNYLDELASGSRSIDDEHLTLDTSSIHGITDPQARKRARKLHVLLEPLAYPLYESETGLDPFSHFLIHRSHRIDEETGLLELVPQLVAPFLHHSEYLRTWFISTVIPLLRIGYEYYPSDPAPSLERFAQLNGKRAVDTLLSHLRPGHGTQPDNREPARDLRGIVGPWICGANDRKRRILDVEDRRMSVDLQQARGFDDWESLFEWLVHTSKEDLPLICSAFSEWDGPNDMDLGGFDEGQEYLDEAQQGELERKYAQAALATLYLAEDSNSETVHTAHALLARLSSLLSLDAPCELDVGVDSMPVFDIKSPVSEECTTSIVQEENLLRTDNPITRPSQEAIRLLELFMFSTHLLSGLQYPISIRDVARMYLRNDHAEQASLVQRILHSLGSGSKKNAGHWKTIRSTLLWLWSWGSTNANGDRHAQGLFGHIEPKGVETEILKAMLENGHSSLAIQIYLQSASGQTPLTATDVENALLSSTLHYYDNATNGNRTRGGMKRASDIITAFSPHFPSSSRFRRVQALLSATHAMSFYSLILQHGVPFQPVNIRVSSDPLSLLRKLLAQNRGSYTKLDDLVSIGQNLVTAMPSSLMDDDLDDSNFNAETVEKKKAAAERRVIGMAIETALEEDDFETAYSYVVNRLTPPSGSPAVSPAASLSSQRLAFGSYDSDKEDDNAEDIPWRAALQAGRYGASSVSSSSTWSGSAAHPDLRRLEQRMELLSQALLLAPPSHLEEVLAVWQDCEKEMTTLLAHETEVEERFNDAADQRLPGAFTNDTVAIQPRREVGRGAVEEAPMGLFDVARGAAAAFSKSAFPLRSASGASRQEPGEVRDEGRVSMDLGSDEGSMYGNEDRVRRRDMVANAVTGGLASGIGWVLGAKPVSEQDR